MKKWLSFYIMKIFHGFLFSNTGSETHQLKFCEFAGWDSEEQFLFGPAPCYANTDIPSEPNLQQTNPGNPYLPFIQAPGRDLIAGHGLNVLHNSSSVPVEEDEERHENGIEVDIDEEAVDDRGKNAEEAPSLRAMERNLKLLPGEKVSIAVVCQAK